MTNYDYYMVRSFILNALNPKNVKVSFYLQDKSQSQDGNLVICPPDVSGFNIEKIGTRYDGPNKVDNVGMKNFPCYKFVKNGSCGDYMNEKREEGGNVFEK